MAIYYPPPPPLVAAGAAQPYGAVRSAVVPSIWTRDVPCPGQKALPPGVLASWDPGPALPLVAAGAAQPYGAVRSAVVPSIWTRDVLLPGPPICLQLMLRWWVPPDPRPQQPGVPLPIIPRTDNPPLYRGMLPPGVLASWDPGPPRPEPIRARPAYFLSRVIRGVTRDLNGSPLGGCTVKCYDSGTDAVVFTVISDANGNYGGIVPGSGAYYLVAYKAAAPHVAGTSVNTLVGS